MGTDFTPSSSSTPSPEHKSHVPKTWSIGTLTYTTAGLCLLFFWLLWGDFAWSIKDRSMGAVTQLVLRKFQATDFIVGLIAGTIPPLIGMFLGPIVSYYSDRYRSKWGRRVPFILVPTPFIFLSMVGLAFSGYLGSHLHQFLGLHSPGIHLCSIIVFGFFWSLFDITTTIANAVFGALVNDVVPHQVIGRFFGLFRAISLIAGMIFNYLVLGVVEDYYTFVFLGIGIVYSTGVAFMCFNVKEGEYPPPPPKEEGTSSTLKTTFSYFKQCFGKEYYICYYLFSTLATLCFLPINFFSIFYAKSLSMDMHFYGKLIAVSYLVSLILAYPLGSLVDRFHPLRVTLIAMGLYLITTICGAFFIKDTTTFTIAFVTHNIISGIFFTTSASLPQMLLPRLSFAQYASASGIITSIVTMTTTPLLGLILDFTHHQYRYTFFASGILCSVAFFSGVVLYKKFMKLGGPKNYVAPE